MSILAKELPIPRFFDEEKVSQVWRVPYQKIAAEAKEWAKLHHIKPACEDKITIALLLIDVQNTFCIPEFELFVGGNSGNGAVEDNIRLCKFIYQNLGRITSIFPTMDTHRAMQIFHPIFWIDEAGNHPPPMTSISYEDVRQGIWQVNPAISHHFRDDIYYNTYSLLQKYALHYTKQLEENNKYTLTIWPYHSILGGIGHALVSSVEEAIFFHNLTRNTQTNFEIKGENTLTESYSVLGPEVLEGQNGKPIAQKNTLLLQKLLSFDKIIIAGQAKSHCVAWSIEDLLREIMKLDANLAKKVYLLEDSTSPVVVPNVVDFSSQADAAFERFAKAGMQLVKSTNSLENWL